MTIKPFKNRSIDPDKPVEVYLNLHKKDDDGNSWYSIRQGGKVVGHADRVDLTGVNFIVHSKGRDRVRSEKRKNVHAWVRGFHTHVRLAFAKTPAYYNPMRDDQFMCEGKPVTVADNVRMEVGGKVFLHRA